MEVRRQVDICTLLVRFCGSTRDTMSQRPQALPCLSSLLLLFEGGPKGSGLDLNLQLRMISVIDTNHRTYYCTSFAVLQFIIRCLPLSKVISVGFVEHTRVTPASGEGGRRRRIASSSRQGRDI